MNSGVSLLGVPRFYVNVLSGRQQAIPGNSLRIALWLIQPT
jgi:hypothetical protein